MYSICRMCLLGLSVTRQEETLLFYFSSFWSRLFPQFWGNLCLPFTFLKTLCMRLGYSSRITGTLSNWRPCVQSLAANNLSLYIMRHTDKTSTLEASCKGLKAYNSLSEHELPHVTLGAMTPPTSQMSIGWLGMNLVLRTNVHSTCNKRWITIITPTGMVICQGRVRL